MLPQKPLFQEEKPAGSHRVGGLRRLLRSPPGRWDHPQGWSTPAAQVCHPDALEHLSTSTLPYVMLLALTPACEISKTLQRRPRTGRQKAPDL